MYVLLVITLKTPDSGLSRGACIYPDAAKAAREKFVSGGRKKIFSRH